ncbi:hypothetical protein R1sor_000812 [Riccia sorocarpa]|uniref:BOS complex subunit NCLN n=1 Tax=Riccia sorocarpa TaxID=122646 RepID=A0ABD3GXB8_9MARC
MGKERSGMMVLSVRAVAALLVVVAVAYIEICDAAAVVDVYRMIQYDFQGTPFGSRRAAVNHHATSGLSVTGSDLSRTVVILPVDKANVTLLNEYLQSKKMLGGLLLILPRDFEKGGKSSGESDSEDADGDGAADIAALEQWLIHNNIPYPVYFAFSDDRINSLLKDVQLNDAAGRPATASTGGYKLVVSASDAKKLSSASYTNIQGWLWGARGEADVAGLPTIAIVASYDTFGAAPALAVGSDSNGSGVVALLELARLFSRLYANAKARPAYNLLFGLTSAGPYNYNGTARWLRGFDQRVRENIDYALCLNSIGNSGRIRLHVSKPPDNPVIKEIHDNIAAAAGNLGVTIEVRQKKINISNSRVALEHEQFSRNRITAATISELETPPDFLDGHGGIADRRSNVNDALVVRNIKLIAEAIAKHVYALEGKSIEVFPDGSSFAVDPHYVKRWLDLLSRTPRVAPFLGKNGPIIAALQKELAAYATDVTVQHDTLDGAFTFYDTTKAQLTIYQVASVTFDLFIMIAVGIYLGILFVILVVTTKGFDDLVGAFRRPPSRKLKGN